MSSPTCWVCGSPELEEFFEARGLPVHCNVLWSTAAQARRAPRGDIRLAVCRRCGMIGNLAFRDEAVHYDAAYENSLHFSAEFQRYATSLADDLVDRHALRGKTVLEIGCGKGEFLHLLCLDGRCRGVGVDASYEPTEETTAPHLRFVRAPFRADESAVPADLIVCRHVLEHIPEPRAFAGEIARAARRRDGCVVFIEVPSVLYTLRDLGIWDIIYEHCLYFSAAPLAMLFEAAGLTVQRTDHVYGGQFLSLEAATGPSATRWSGPASDIVELTQVFAAHHRRKVSYWRERLGTWRAEGRRVVVWGSGSKGVTFLNMVAGAGGVVDAVVDINPRKHGRYVAGMSDRIVPPEALRDAPPDHVLLMNPLYGDEVRSRLAQLGLAPALEVV